MSLPTRADFARIAQQSQAIKQLAEADIIKSVLHEDTVFATMAFCCEVIGSLREKMDISAGSRATSWSWEGIDEDKTSTGYLSHNGAILRFQTKDATIFALPFNQLKIEPHGLGLLLTLPAKQYVIGNYMPVNEQFSPNKKMNYNFGSESVIWMRELGEIGAVDKTAYEKSRSGAKLFVIFWFAFIAALSILIIKL